MSFFTGKTKLVNASPIPSSTAKSSSPGKVTKEAAVALLHDHDFFLKTDPHHVSHRTLAPVTEDEKESSADAAAARQTYQLPRDVEPVGRPAVCVYEVVDHVPNPVWSSSVVSREELVSVKDGLFVRIRSPLAVVMETRWYVRERKGAVVDNNGEKGEEGEAELELVEDCEITCSKLLVGIVKGQVDNNWQGIHARIMARMVEDAKKSAP
ncbi:hypothetical protein F4821DRAFT_82174 [Hypoxylon rubiginosum]|uniref:Uncharacterized protein n=1 Tax=Hypoxylon rubiginosum TaxID=110542 RepID=A0ACC0D899_9PEZI|nr:hypothetical protein F4821DRAFT_82174 [Hypoxylon rubiginosum]